MNQATRQLINRHPLQAFFLLAIAAMFVLLFPAMFIIPQNTMFWRILGFTLAKMAAFSPVLAGMFVARIIQPQKQKVPVSRRVRVFLPAWLIATIIQTASLKLTARAETPLTTLVLISLPVALLPALVISSVFSGSNGTRQMLVTIVKPKGHIVYYLIALLVFPFIHIVGTGITNVMDGGAWFPQVSQGADLALTIFITFFSVLLFSGGINEEAGWRGFAQRRLQERCSPLVANLILWIMMLVWHIPNDIIQYRDGGYILVRIGLYPFITIFFGWIYNRTNGSILAPAIFHASMNSMNPLMRVFPMTSAGNILLVGLAVVAILSDLMWRRLPGDHPAAYQKDSHSDSIG